MCLYCMFCNPLCSGNFDIVSCTKISGDETTQHFMVVNDTEFLLVNPYKSRLGYGVVHFITFIQVGMGGGWSD